jgi:acyl-CoA thioester hydrolase
MSDEAFSGPYSVAIPTRWMDTDAYGHVNNVQYYSYFDTAVTTWLVRVAGLDPETAGVIGLCAESQCRFHEPLRFPDTVTAGLEISHIGQSSVRYELTLNRSDGEKPVAVGHFVHVFVDSDSRRPVPIPDPLRHHMKSLLRPPVPGDRP